MDNNKQHPKFIGARIKAARQAAGYKSAQVFCKKHKIPYQTHSQHVRGTRKPTAEYLKNYSRWLNVKEHWLTTGEGEPFKQGNEKTDIKDNLAVLETKAARPQSVNSTIINKELLKEILLALDTLNLKPSDMATASSEIYTDIVTTEPDTTLQIKMIPPMIVAYRRFLERK